MGSIAIRAWPMLAIWVGDVCAVVPGTIILLLRGG